MTDLTPLSTVEQQAVDREEAGWLIEVYNQATETYDARWWTGDPDVGWTTDSLAAVRFPTKRAADLYIFEAGWTSAKATEHAWINPLTQQAERIRVLEEAARIEQAWSANDRTRAACAEAKVRELEATTQAGWKKRALAVERERDAAEHRIARMVVEDTRNADLIAAQQALETAREGLEHWRTLTVRVMRALMASNLRGDLLLADEVHKADADSRETLLKLKGKADV